MKRKKFKEDHLDLYLKSTYLQRLNWLEKAHEFVKKMIKLSKKIKDLKKLLFILLFIFLFISYSFSAKLNIPDSLIIERTLYLVPQSTPPTCDADSEGKIYYDANDKTIKYCDGSGWKDLRGKERSVATVIVAAKDSLDTVCDASGCTNERADFTCDGISDQVEINQAINSLPPEGGAVYLLEGTYNLTGSIHINKDNVSLIGQGRGTILKINGIVINASGTSSDPLTGILISKLKIEGELRFNCIEKSAINSLWIKTLHDVHCSNYKHNIFSENFLKTSMGSLWVNSSSSNIFANNIFEGLELWLTANSNNNIVESNIIYNVPFYMGVGIIYLQDKGNIIMGNSIHNCPAEPTGIGVRFNASNNVICANSIFDVKLYGILLSSSPEENLVSSNLIHLLSSNNAKGIDLAFDKNLVTANLIKEEASCNALHLNSLSNENLITFNYIDSSYTSGYAVDNDGSDNYFVGNQIVAPNALKFSDDGTNTQHIQKEKITLERQTVTLSSSPATLEVATTPRGYVVFDTGGSNIQLGDPANNINAINDGKAQGDLLILEGPSSGSVTIKNGANVKLKGGLDRTLQSEDTLTLIWNGSDWIEIAYSDN